MSVFRPVNYAESNLFTIRLIVDFDLQSSGVLTSPSIVVRGPLPSYASTSTTVPNNNLLLILWTANWRNIAVCLDATNSTELFFI